MGDDRAIGVTLGIGVVAGLTFLLTRKASASSIGSPRDQSSLPLAPQRPGHFPMLVERWRREVALRAKDLPVDAILRWIQIESGGDMCSVGGPTEVGIFQLFFPSDAKYGATLEGLRAICQKSKRQKPADISWLSPGELEMEVGAGIRKVFAARDDVRRDLAATGTLWPEGSFDFGAAVKQIHAAPAVITELLPKIAHRDGAPASWHIFRQAVMTFPIDQMGTGLQKLARMASRHGLSNRLEDTLANAEDVGRAWAVAAAA